ENGEVRGTAVPLEGSPPRVWGKRWSSNYASLPCRFTPTRVGKTNRLVRYSSMNTVHPHACGENFPFLLNNPRSVGSPPRVWGKHVKQLLYRLSDRFTPTRVGKT